MYWMWWKRRIIILLTTKEGRKAGETFHGIDLVLCFSFPDNKNPCHLSEAPGPCRGLLSRYYYDSKSQQCKHFFYGGCFGNANNFRSMAECHAKCQSPGRSFFLDTTSTVLKAWKMKSFLQIIGWAKTFFFAGIDEWLTTWHMIVWSKKAKIKRVTVQWPLIIFRQAWNQVVETFWNWLRKQQVAF